MSSNVPWSDTVTVNIRWNRNNWLSRTWTKTISIALARLREVLRGLQEGNGDKVKWHLKWHFTVLLLLGKSWRKVQVWQQVVSWDWEPNWLSQYLNSLHYLTEDIAWMVSSAIGSSMTTRNCSLNKLKNSNIHTCHCVISKSVDQKWMAFGVMSLLVNLESPLPKCEYGNIILLNSAFSLFLGGGYI